MTAWIVSIVGIVFLGVLVDVVAPNGKTNTIIKCVFGIFTLVVMISPVISLFKKDWNIDMDIEYSFLNQLRDEKVQDLEIEIGEYLSQNNIPCVVEIEAEYVANCLNISNVKIYISADVLNNMDEHINKYKHITSMVKKVVEVDEEIVIYEVI